MEHKTKAWVVLTVATSILLGTSPSYSATWTVPTVECPTFVAALDSARGGDIIELECGVYDFCGAIITEQYDLYPGITIRSVTGDPECVEMRSTQPCAYTFYFIGNQTAHHTIQGITFTGDGDSQDGVKAGGQYITVDIENCTFKDCRYGATLTYGGSVHGSTFVNNRGSIGGSWPIEISNCLIANNLYGPNWSHDFTVECTNIFGNFYSNWENVGCSQPGLDGNISEDPEFCDYDNQDFSLTDESPCAPANSGCGLIGSLPVGCASPPEYEVVSITPDLGYYENGVDQVNLTASIRNNSGITYPSLVAEVRGANGFSEEVYTTFVSLPAGQVTSVPISFTAPDPGASLEYDVVLTIDGVHYTYHDAFVGTAVPREEVEIAWVAADECWMDEDRECLAYALSVIPFVSIGTHAALLAEHMCEAAIYRNTGRMEESWAAMRLAIGHGVWSYIGMIPGLGEVGWVLTAADAQGSAADWAERCYDEEFEAYEGTMKASLDDTVSTMGAWFSSAVDSLDASIADIVLARGDLLHWVEADSSWAREDSLGLRYAHISRIFEDVVMSQTTPNLHRIGFDETNNPMSLI